MNNCMKPQRVRRITKRRKDDVETIKLDELLN